MTNRDVEHIWQRLSLAEKEIARARAQGAVASLLSLAAVTVTVGASWWSPAVHADAPATVRAPFMVVDAANQPILKVQDASPEQGPRGAFVLNAQGQIVAHASVRSNGHGAVFARHATKGLNGPGAGMYFDDDGNGAFGMRGTDGKSIIEINRKALSIYDPTSLHVFNSSKYAAVTLEVSKNGSGYLSIGDPGGEAVVEAGVAVDSGVGQVRAGPASAPKGQGIPPSFIKGWKKK